MLERSGCNNTSTSAAVHQICENEIVSEDGQLHDKEEERINQRVVAEAAEHLRNGDAGSTGRGRRWDSRRLRRKHDPLLRFGSHLLTRLEGQPFESSDGGSERSGF